MDAKGDEKRARIVSAAQATFLKAGYQEANLRDIGAAAGSSLGGIYRFFSGKEVLYAALIAPALQLFDTHFPAALCADMASFPAKFAQGVVGFATAMYDNMDDMRVLTMVEGAPSQSALAEKAAQLGEPLAAAASIPVQTASMLLLMAFLGVVDISRQKLPQEAGLAYAQQLGDFVAAGWRQVLAS